MGKDKKGKASKDVEEGGGDDAPPAEKEEKDTLDDDKTRCGNMNTCWCLVIFVLMAASFFCFVTPLRFYEDNDALMPRTTCDTVGTGDDAVTDCTKTSTTRGFKTVFTMISDPPGASSVEWWDYGKDFKKMMNNFDFSFHCRYLEGTAGFVPTDLYQARCGIITLDVLILWFSTLCAFPYFFVFTFFPGWAYKIHFKGSGTMRALCPTRNGKIPSCKTKKLPLSCATLAAAADEQNHQGDQIGRLLGLFVGAAFGIPLFFCRFGARGQAAVEDSLMANLATWTLVLVWHISSIVNRSVPLCYAVYQLVFTAVICGLIFLSFPTSEDALGFSLQKEWDKQFVETKVEFPFW